MNRKRFSNIQELIFNIMSASYLKNGEELYFQKSLVLGLNNKSILCILSISM